MQKNDEVILSLYNKKFENLEKNGKFLGTYIPTKTESRRIRQFELLITRSEIESVKTKHSLKTSV